MTDKKPKSRRPLERQEPLNDAHLMESHRQCPAISKRTGERCKRFCALGMKTCRWHGSATRVAKTAAAKRIAQASGYAADMLVEFMADPDVQIDLRTKIAQDLLNRAGINSAQLIQLQESKRVDDLIGGFFVEASDDDGRMLFGDYRDQLALRNSPQEDIVDADVVEDDPPVRTRHDRAAFAQVARSRRAERLGTDRAELEADERHAFDAAPVQSKGDVERGRAAYLEALDAGMSQREARIAADNAARGVTAPEGRARVTEAEFSSPKPRKRRQR